MVKQQNVDGLVALVSQPAAPVSPPVIASSQFFIESLVDQYKVHGVSYLGKVCVVDIDKELSDHGNAHTQDEWRTLIPNLPSSTLYFVVMDALYGNKDHSEPIQRALVEEVRQMFAKDFNEYFMMTSTRVHYAHKGLDTVVYDVGYTTEHREEANIVGADGYINGESGFAETMRTLVGIDNCQRISNIGEWVTGKESYLWRFNSKPQNDVERALVLGDDGRFYIDAYVGLLNVRRARGMVAHVAENSP